VEAIRICKSYAGREILAGVSFSLRPGEKVGLVGRNGCGKSTLLRLLAGGQEAVVAHGLSKRYGEKCLFAGLDLTVRRGDRLAIIGRNGAGKTTLLRVLLGRETPDTGSARLGAGITAGYLAQEHENLNPTRTLLEEVRGAGAASEADVRTLLACLLFRRDEVFKRVGDLSEGERVRAALARMLVAGANLLVLDEPTNHLDIATRERIEAALQDYTGTILLVSHDRYLLHCLGRETLLLEDGQATLYPGNYAYVQEKQAASSPSG
jgi:ATP-binding cassette subfamily F protein 3